jgi:chorismate-pyruvate lyase
MTDDKARSRIEVSTAEPNSAYRRRQSSKVPLGETLAANNERAQHQSPSAELQCRGWLEDEPILFE